MVRVIAGWISGGVAGGVLSEGDDLGRGYKGMSREEVSCSTRCSIIVHFNVTFDSNIMNRILRIYFVLRVQWVVLESLKLNQYLIYN